MIKKILCVFSILWSLHPFSQSVDYIKSNPHKYIYGEGKSEDYDEADKLALEAVVSQISSFVISDNSLSKSSSYSSSKEKYTQDFSSVVQTYSSSALTNTRMLLLSPDDAETTHIIRYIKVEDVAKIFESRIHKIKQFFENAQKCEKKYQIADALRYYYWCLMLLKTHPNAGSIKAQTHDGEVSLMGWIPMEINNILANLSIIISEIKGNEKNKEEEIFIQVSYNNKLVSNFDFKYFTGNGWSQIVSANNGEALLEFYEANREMKKIKIKAEYEFKGEARIDKELESIITKLKKIPFKKAYRTLLRKISIQSISNSVDHSKLKSNLLSDSQSENYIQSLNKVLAAIKTRNYSSVQTLFTKEGYQNFIQLMKYGNAKILNSKSLKFYKYESEVIARAINMNFKFKSNHKSFSEKINFSFNHNKKINAINFGLSHQAAKNIIEHKKWKEEDKLVLIRFLESYKTAYALKQLDYIDKIFADDALIITGRVVKLKNNTDNVFADNTIVKYNRLSKAQFMKKLKYSFSSKEYINLKFEDSKIRKSGYKGDVYGINIKQYYYSSNYADKGYLFLIVDLNNKNEPIIHVRTWQPKIGINEEMYGLADF